MEQFEFEIIGGSCSDAEVTGMGFNTTGYAGAFTPTINKIIKEIIFDLKSPNVLNLFSGVSKIGNVRIDIERPEATLRMDVLDFIRNNGEHWDLVILDPPYEIKRKKKLEQYGKTSSVAADVEFRRALADFFYNHADNVLWLDLCAPLPKGFKRQKVWFLFPGGYHTVRTLSWLRRKQ